MNSFIKIIIGFCIIILGFNNFTFAQNCKLLYDENIAKIKENKSIFFYTDEMPECCQNVENTRQLFVKMISSIISNACPTRIICGFVIEQDSSISNIFACANMI